ncbi:MAG: helix-turn-helix domain-containing protein [Cytophagales bacterium]|nr:helix-turn-helix domain-containing protein [Cytophagales bacterium]
MNIIKYLDRIKKMDDLIQRKATGTPEEFAEKMGLSRIALLKYIKLLKDMNAPIEYSYSRRSYYYFFPCRLKLGFESKLLDDEELISLNKKSLKKFCEIILV